MLSTLGEIAEHSLSRPYVVAIALSFRHSA
jgi:hypothetical protein